MISHTITFLSLPLLVSAESTTEGWKDFTNNFATDLAPLIALFGEQVTKQFLSESTDFLDNIIFGVAPLGILTAVVSAIRVYGNASLKAIIGRAQEAHGIAEAELCSSTSQDVCELWSNGGISRVFGRPKMLEFFFCMNEKNEKEYFYPSFPKPPLCGIHCPNTFLPLGKSPRNAGGSESPECEGIQRGWKEIGPKSQADPSYAEKDQLEFAPHPNISLNIGIRTTPPVVRWIAAIFGVLLQLGFFGYATWATFYNKEMYDGKKSPKQWSFWLAASGMTLLVLGMTLCAMLIERSTHERRFEGLINLFQ